MSLIVHVLSECFSLGALRIGELAMTALGRRRRALAECRRNANSVISSAY